MVSLKNAPLLPVMDAETKTDKDLEKLNIQERRVIDAYREGIIDIDELKDQKAKIAGKRKTLEARKKAAQGRLESAGHTEITMDIAR